MKRTWNHYQLIREIGRGGSGRVLLAEDRRLHRTWAIKELRTDGDAASRTAAAQALAEAKLLSELAHPAIPRVVDIRTEGGRSWIIMDYVEGTSLKEALARRGSISPREALRFARELCGILVYLHGLDPPVLYRDLKPSNLICGRDGALHIIDFGTAVRCPGGTIREEAPRGTPGYAAPEQYAGRSDARSDLYAFGVILQQMLTGRDPTNAAHRRPRIHRPGSSLEEGLLAIARRAAARAPDRRYPDASTLAAELAHPERCSPRFRLAQRRGMRLFAALLISSVLFILSGILFRGLSQYTIDQICHYALHPPDGLSPARQIALLRDAIEAAPDRLALYESYLSVCESANVFDEKNAEMITAQITQNRERLDLRSEEGMDVLFRIARLYWYAYRGGDGSPRTRILMAQPWLEELAEACGVTEAGRWPCSAGVLAGYRNIADFYARYVSDMPLVEEPRREEYEVLLSAMKDALSDMDGDVVGAREQLEFLQALLQLLQTYRVGFVTCGIPEATLQQTVGEVQEKAQQTRPAHSDAVELRRDVLREATRASAQIAHGYESWQPAQTVERQ